MANREYTFRSKPQDILNDIGTAQEGAYYIIQDGLSVFYGSILIAWNVSLSCWLYQFYPATVSLVSAPKNYKLTAEYKSTKQFWDIITQNFYVDDPGFYVTTTQSLAKNPVLGIPSIASQLPQLPSPPDTNGNVQIGASYNGLYWVQTSSVNPKTCFLSNSTAQGDTAFICYFPDSNVVSGERFFHASAIVTARSISSILRTSSAFNFSSDNTVSYGDACNILVKTIGSLYPQIAASALLSSGIDTPEAIQQHSNLLHTLILPEQERKRVAMGPVVAAIEMSQVRNGNSMLPAGVQAWSPLSQATLQDTYPSECQIYIDLTDKDHPRGHIPGDMPPRPPIAACPIASDAASIVLEEGSFLRVGDVRLPLTVEHISVSETDGLDKVPLLRTRGTEKRSSGHFVTRVNIQVIYKSIEDINGFTIDFSGAIIEDPVSKEKPIMSGILFEHYGLRPLIATFRRAPFIPIINSELNERYHIDAVAFEGIQIQTEDGAPEVLRATLSFLKFDYQAFLPTATNFASLFNWPLYQKYVYNGLCITEERGQLPRQDSHFIFNAPAPPVPEYLQSPNNMAIILAQNTPASIAASAVLAEAQKTGLWKSEDIDTFRDYVTLRPSYFQVAKVKNAKGQVIAPKLTPVPSLRYDAASKAYSRNSSFDGTLVFKVASEASLKAIRDFSIENKQLLEDKQRLLDSLRNAQAVATLTKLNSDYTDAVIATRVAGAAAHIHGITDIFGAPAEFNTFGVQQFDISHTLGMSQKLQSAYDAAVAREVSLLKALKSQEAKMKWSDQTRLANVIANDTIVVSKCQGALDAADAAAPGVLSTIAGAIGFDTAGQKASDIKVHAAEVALAEAKLRLDKDQRILTAFQDKLYIANQDEINRLEKDMKDLEKQISEMSEDSIEFVDVALPTDTIFSAIQVGMYNSFSQLQLVGRTQPTLQYMGGTDTQVVMQFQCQEDSVQALRQLHEHVQHLSREYRWISGRRSSKDGRFEGSVKDGEIKGSEDRFLGQQLETAFLLIKNEVVNLCGVDSVLIESIEYEAVPETPGWYTVSLSMVDFCRTQKKHEALNRAQGVGAQSTMGTQMQILNPDLNPIEASIENMQKQDKFNDMVYSVELYPDLELPTLATVNAWIAQIYQTVTDLDYPSRLFRAAYYQPPENDPRMFELVHVDPDFYITTDELTVGDMLVEQLASEPSGQIVAYSDQHDSGFAVSSVPRDHPISTNPRGATGEHYTLDLDPKINPTTGEPITTTGVLLTNLKNSTTTRNATVPSSGVNTPLQVRMNNKDVAADLARVGVSTSTDTLTETNGTQPTLGSVPVGKDLAGATQNPPDTRFSTVRGHHSAWTDTQKYANEYGFPTGVNGGVEFKEGSIFANFADGYQYGKQGQLIRAFPTFWFVLIDSGRMVNQYVMNDNFYGMNALQSITVVKNREKPGHLAEIEMANIYGNLTNATAQRALDTGIRRPLGDSIWYYVSNIVQQNPDAADVKRREQEVTGLSLQAGNRVHIRLGYGSCPQALPVVFNGTIVEVPAGDGVVTVIAMGDGIELMNDVQASPNQTLGGYCHGTEPQELLSSMLGARGGLPSSLANNVLDRMEAWFQNLAYSVCPGLIPDNPLGIQHFGNPFYQIGAERWGEVMQNIYRSNDRGARPGHTLIYERPDSVGQPDTDIDGQLDSKYPDFHSADCLSEFLAFTETLSWGQKEFSTELFGKTVWDLCVMSAQVAPDYICSVVPFGFRSSLFYGKPYYPYCYDYKMSQLKVPPPPSYLAKHGPRWVPYGSIPEHWQSGSPSARNAPQSDDGISWVSPFKLIGTILEQANPFYQSEGNALGTTNPGTYVKYCNPTLDSTIQDIYGTDDAGKNKIMHKFVYAELRKPFQQIYSVTSADDIIVNNILASSEGVYTVVRGTSKCHHFGVSNVLSVLTANVHAEDPDTGASIEMTVPVYADYTVFPENKRVVTVDTGIYVSSLDQDAMYFTNRDVHGNMANNVATSILKNFMSYMYKGGITTIGIPSIKPHDIIIIDDVYNELHGPIGVREVVLKFDGETGFTTSIEPDCLVSIADERLQRNWSTFRSIAGQTALERISLAQVSAKQPDSGEYINLHRKAQLLIDLYETYQGYTKDSAGTYTPQMHSQDIKNISGTISDPDSGILPVYRLIQEQLRFGISFDPTFLSTQASLLGEHGVYNPTGAYQYMKSDHYRWELEEERKFCQILGIDSAHSPVQSSTLVDTQQDWASSPSNQLPKKALSGQQQHDRDVLLHLPSMQYRFPHDIGGAPPSYILALSRILAGQNDINYDKTGLVGLLCSFLVKNSVDAQIITAASRNLQSQDPVKYAAILSAESSSVQQQLAWAHSIDDKITGWCQYSSPQWRTEVEARSKHNTAMKILAKHAPEQYEQALHFATLAECLIQVKIAQGSNDVSVRALQGVSSLSGVNYEEFNQGFSDLGRAYSIISGAIDLYKSSGRVGVLYQDASSSFVADYLMQQSPNSFSPAALALNNEVSTYQQLLRIGGDSVGRYVGSKYLIKKLLNSPMMTRLVLRNMSTTGALKSGAKSIWNGVRSGVSTRLDKFLDLEAIVNEDNKFKFFLAHTRKRTANFFEENLTGKGKLWPNTVDWLKNLTTDATEATREWAKGVRASEQTGKLLKGFAGTVEEADALYQEGKAAIGLMEEAKKTKQAVSGLKTFAQMIQIGELTNPVGWIAFALTSLATIAFGNLVNKMNRAMMNLHAVQIMVLHKHGVEFSAGMQGHQGLVYGDQVNRLSRIAGQIAGSVTSDDTDIPKGSFAITGLTVVTSLLGIKMPYVPEMSHAQQAQYQVVDGLFNARQFGETYQSVVQARLSLGDLGILLSDILRTPLVPKSGSKR